MIKKSWAACANEAAYLISSGYSTLDEPELTMIIYNKANGLEQVPTDDPKLAVERAKWSEADGYK